MQICAAVEEACGLVDDLQREWRIPVGIGFQDPTLYGHPADFRGTEAHSAVVKAVREKFCAEELPKFMGFLSKRLAGGGGWRVALGRLRALGCARGVDATVDVRGFLFTSKT